MLAAPDVEVGELATGDVPAVSATDDQEHVARLMKSADLMVVPVVEEDGRLVGIVTFDDAMEVLEFEEGEDLARLVMSLEEEMHEAAKDLRFEYAARLRDEVNELKRELREVAEAG